MHKFYYIAVVFFIWGCTKEVMVDIPKHEKSLVVDGRIETGQPPIIMLSTTHDIYAETGTADLAGSFQTSATVSVSDGMNTFQLQEICSDSLPPGVEDIFAQFFGINPANLNGLNLCLYTSLNDSILGEVGKTYQLTIDYEGEIYTGSTTLLPPVPLDTVYWKEESDRPDNGYFWAQITDPGATTDAYYWQSKRINKKPNGEEKDAMYKSTFLPAIRDDFFNGLSFKFSYENPHSYEDETIPDKNKGLYQRGDSVVAKFSKIDLPVYDFLEKKYTQLQSGGSPFAGSNNIPSNISNGAKGVFAGYSTTFDTLYCDE